MRIDATPAGLEARYRDVPR